MTRRIFTRISHGALLGTTGLLAGTAIFGNWLQGYMFGAGAAVLTWAGVIKIGDQP